MSGFHNNIRSVLQSIEEFSHRFMAVMADIPGLQHRPVLRHHCHLAEVTV
jgi:hypothetical protein